MRGRARLSFVARPANVLIAQADRAGLSQSSDGGSTPPGDRSLLKARSQQRSNRQALGTSASTHLEFYASPARPSDDLTLISEPSATGATQLQLGLEEFLRRAFSARRSTSTGSSGAARGWHDAGAVGAQSAGRSPIRAGLATTTNAAYGCYFPCQSSAKGATQFQPGATPQETPIHT